MDGAGVWQNWQRPFLREVILRKRQTVSVNTGLCRRFNANATAPTVQSYIVMQISGFNNFSRSASPGKVADVVRTFWSGIFEGE